MKGQETAREKPKECDSCHYKTPQLERYDDRIAGLKEADRSPTHLRPPPCHLCGAVHESADMARMQLRVLCGPLHPRAPLRGAMTEKTIPPNATCAHCGQKAKAHWLANYSDGPYVGVSVLVCPTSTWKQKQQRKSRPSAETRE